MKGSKVTARTVPGPALVLGLLVVVALLFVLGRLFLPFPEEGADGLPAPPTTGTVLILLERAASTPLQALERGEHDGSFTVLLLEALPAPPGDLLAVLSGARVASDRSRVSALERNFVEEVAFETHGARLEGTVRFRLGARYEGVATFTARPVGGRWAVTEICLPEAGRCSRVGEDGRWRIEDV